MSPTGTADNIQVLLVEDEPSVVGFVSAMLRREGNYHIQATESLRAALTAIEKQRWNLLIADLSLPDGDGTRAIEMFRKRNAGAGVVVITGYPDEAKVRQLEAYEISSFLVKPFDAQQLKYSIIGALERSRISAQNEVVSAETDRNSDLGLVGVSSHIEELRDRIRELARGRLPVLVTGPSGTGKEIIARAMHASSDRHGNPIFAINCAAIPRHLEEAEFFGYVKGAFTGATASKNGIIASADGSTLFLDEIGELSLPVQAKLLRVLDSGEYLRIGEVQPHVVDIRVVSATNRDLETMVSEGSFREDLYFRLKGAMIVTRPLSEHIEDVPYLVDHFLRSDAGGKLPTQVTNEALALLKQYDWPGNVRELRLVVNYLRTACAGLRRINGAAVKRVLKIPEQGGDETALPFAAARQQFEKTYFAGLLKRCHGNVAQAARLAHLHRPNLLRKIKELGISADEFRIHR
ncbi:MAG: response regulator [Chitinivibrionales bacterium]|nr:response regulator [Chitinivibrionales bacterium]